MMGFTEDIDRGRCESVLKLPRGNVLTDTEILSMLWYDPLDGGRSKSVTFVPGVGAVNRV